MSEFVVRIASLKWMKSVLFIADFDDIRELKIYDAAWSTTRPSKC